MHRSLLFPIVGAALLAAAPDPLEARPPPPTPDTSASIPIASLLPQVDGREMVFRDSFSGAMRPGVMQVRALRNGIQETTLTVTTSEGAPVFRGVFLSSPRLGLQLESLQLLEHEFSFAGDRLKFSRGSQSFLGDTFSASPPGNAPIFDRRLTWDSRQRGRRDFQVPEGPMYPEAWHFQIAASGTESGARRGSVQLLFAPDVGLVAVEAVVGFHSISLGLLSQDEGRTLSLLPLLSPTLSAP